MKKSKLFILGAVGLMSLTSCGAGFQECTFEEAKAILLKNDAKTVEFTKVKNVLYIEKLKITSNDTLQEGILKTTIAGIFKAMGFKECVEGEKVINELDFNPSFKFDMTNIDSFENNSKQLKSGEKVAFKAEINENGNGFIRKGETNLELNEYNLLACLWDDFLFRSESNGKFAEAAIKYSRTFTYSK